ncbi:MAG: SDR family oxidoreductase [Desulfurellaceae bacterium]|nr:SDR family oxidoreductase [Desulfurellaceae bacterium]
MTETFKSKVALVTGGSSGIGRATALAFAQRGARVVVADLGVEGGEETASLIQNTGGEALFIQTDVAQANEIEHLVGKTVETYGQLDCALNNAGIAGDLSLTADCSEEHWNRVMSINLRGVWLCMKHELPQMLKQGSGAIVNTASVLGLVGIIGQAAYVAAKHGVVGLTKTAALEYAKSGIRVNAVCPGVIQTPMVEGVINAQPELTEGLLALEPVGRLGKPEEIAQTAVWLCSDAASFVTGHSMAADGGYTAQ